MHRGNKETLKHKVKKGVKKATLGNGNCVASAQWTDTHHRHHHLHHHQPPHHQFSGQKCSNKQCKCSAERIRVKGYLSGGHKCTNNNRGNHHRVAAENGN